MSVTDTVVLMYFLLTDREELLLELLGATIRVPVAVYDPAESNLDMDTRVRSDLLSEMSQAIRHYDVASRTDPAAGQDADRLRRLHSLVESRRIEVVDLTPQERLLAARLQSRRLCQEYGIKVPLGGGEASCVAIAWTRGWTIVTDDQDALRVLKHLNGEQDFPYERIRKLLMRAATSKLITRGDANLIHSEMRRKGFWDYERPFP